MQPLTVISRARARRADRSETACADSVLAQLSNGAAVEFLRVRQPEVETSYWLRTINLRPVPAVDGESVVALFARMESPSFRLYQLSRQERQLVDLLGSPELTGDKHDLISACERARALELEEFQQGSTLSATTWLSLGARFAHHAMRLGSDIGQRIWLMLEDEAHDAFDLDACRLAAETMAGIQGCIRAQDAALVGREQALEQLRAVLSRR